MTVHWPESREKLSDMDNKARQTDVTIWKVPDIHDNIFLMQIKKLGCKFYKEASYMTNEKIYNILYISK